MKGGKRGGEKGGERKVFCLILDVVWLRKEEEGEEGEEGGGGGGRKKEEPFQEGKEAPMVEPTFF